MSKKKKLPRSPSKATSSFLENLRAGDYGPIDRAMRVAGNIARRGLFGRRQTCCGNYGDPGC